MLQTKNMECSMLILKKMIIAIISKVKSSLYFLSNNVVNTTNIFFGIINNPIVLVIFCGGFWRGEGRTRERERSFLRLGMIAGVSHVAV